MANFLIGMLVGIIACYWAYTTFEGKMFGQMWKYLYLDDCYEYDDTAIPVDFPFNEAVLVQARTGKDDYSSIDLFVVAHPSFIAISPAAKNWVVKQMIQKFKDRDFLMLYTGLEYSQRAQHNFNTLNGHPSP